MPSLDEMHETCRRLASELRREGLGVHRLLEIETIIRLLVPHLTRAVADAIHSGKAESLGDAGTALIRMRDHLSWVDTHRESDPSETQQQLSDAIHCASEVLDALKRI